MQTKIKWQQTRDLELKTVYCQSPICAQAVETWPQAGLQASMGKLKAEKRQQITVIELFLFSGEYSMSTKEMSATIGIDRFAILGL